MCPRAPALLVLLALWLPVASPFRLYVPRVTPQQNISYLPFEPYEQGFVGYFGQPTNYLRERINEGAANTAAFPRQFDGVRPRQVCPAMVGPLGGGNYYCRGKEYGYCDRRSGTCFCEMGYQGIDCGECTPTHFAMGSLCYPKKLCAGDCSGHGTCNYTIGECICDGGYWGEDCGKLNCKRFDALCDRCSNTTCTTCAEGYSVHKGPNATQCRPCTRFDPRCSACSDDACLDCADPLLTSARRSGYDRPGELCLECPLKAHVPRPVPGSSGFLARVALLNIGFLARLALRPNVDFVDYARGRYRHTDPGLLWDEASRQLSVALPFGTQDGRFFDDAEPFELVASPLAPLSAAAKVCFQGTSSGTAFGGGGPNDGTWTCANTTVTHKVCGHRGTVQWASPSYTVAESNGYLAVTLVRTGGGFGAFEVRYWLEHESTDVADVTATAPYTTSQVVPFPEGAVAMTFKVIIHDDRVFEGDERFVLRLAEPTGASSPVTLGNQRATTVTIRDNDAPLTGWAESSIVGDFDCVAGRVCNFTLHAASTSGARQFSGGDLWLVELDHPSSFHSGTSPFPGALAAAGLSPGSTATPRRPEPGSEAPRGAFAGLGASPGGGGQRRRAAAATGSMLDLGNGTYRGSYRMDRQGWFALRVYLAVGGGTATSLDSGGALGLVYGDYPDGGDFAGGGAYGTTGGGGGNGLGQAGYGRGGNGCGGLRGVYFDSPFLEVGTEAFERVDAVVNFTWGLGRITETGTDFVSVRWEGAVRPPSLAEAGLAASPAAASSSFMAAGAGATGGQREDYTFTVVCDDGVRVWVDHQLIVDQWHAELDGRNASGTASLLPGQLSRIVVEYREARRDAFVSLLWSGPALPESGGRGGIGAAVVVPQAALYHLYELSDTSPRHSPGDLAGDARGGPYAFSLGAGRASEGVSFPGGGGDGLGGRLGLASSGGGARAVYFGPGQGGFHASPGPGPRGPSPVRIVSAATSHELSECVGTGLVGGTAGRPHAFTIVPRDRFGNHRRDEATEALRLDPFSGVASLVDDLGVFGYGVRAVPVTFAYDADAHVFRGAFTPTIRGTYELNVTHSSVASEYADYFREGREDDDASSAPGSSWPSSFALHVRGSPFTVDTAPAPTFAKRCRLWPSSVVSGAAGAALDFGHWHAGLVQSFLIRAHDAFGNLRSVGGDAFEAVAYLNLGGASSSRNEDLDRGGRRLHLADGPDRQRLAESVYGSVHDHGNGSYTVTMRPIKKGAYTLSVTLQGQHVASSPYDVKVHHGAALAAASVATGRGLHTARVSFPARFTFQARDAFSNDLEGPTGGLWREAWTLTGWITAPGGASRPGGSAAVGSPAFGHGEGDKDEDGAAVPVTVTAFANGTALCEYTPRVAGLTLLTVLLRGSPQGKDDAHTGPTDVSREAAHISGSPFEVVVADGPLDGATSVALGPGTTVAEAGEVATFTVQARDPWRNKRSDNGLDGGAAYGDGRLGYERVPREGVDLGASDGFNVTLELLSELSSAHTPVRRGLSYRGGATVFRGTSEYLGDGLHRISYNVTASGVYNLTVRALSNSAGTGNGDDGPRASEGFHGDGHHIVGSPFTPYVGPTGASAVYSSVWGHGLKSSVAGVAQRVHVQTVDLFGNNRTVGGDLVRVYATLHRAAFNASAGPAFGAAATAGPFPLAASRDDGGLDVRDLDPRAAAEAAPRASYRPRVLDLGTGRYEASYVPLVAGKYTVRVVLAQPGGLDGTYFGSHGFTRPLETRQDKTLAFDWGHFTYNTPFANGPEEPKYVTAASTTTATTTVTIPFVDFNANDGHSHPYNNDDDDDDLGNGHGKGNGTGTNTSDGAGQQHWHLGGENRAFNEGRDWREGAAPADFWSARWTGFVRAPASGEEVTLIVSVGEETDHVGLFLEGFPLVGGAGWATKADDARANQPGGHQVHHPFTAEAAGFALPPFGEGWAPTTDREGIFFAAATASARRALGDDDSWAGQPGRAPPTAEARTASAAASAAYGAAVRAGEEARAYEEARYAFGTGRRRGRDVVDGNGGVGPGMGAHALAHLPPSALFGSAAGAGEGSGTLPPHLRTPPHGLWATLPHNSSLAAAATALTTATGRTEYSTSLLFPRPGDLHALELTYRHARGAAKVELSWQSASMPRQPVPASALFRPLPLSGDAYPLEVEPAPTAPESSTVVGRGLRRAVAGEVAAFTVEARDEFGNLRLAGGDVVAAVGTGPGAAHFTADVVDNGDGTYAVRYYPLASGLYSLSVTVGSAGLHRDFGHMHVEESLARAHVRGSPFVLAVAPGPAFGPACTAFGEATFRASAGLGASGRAANGTSPAVRAVAASAGANQGAQAAGGLADGWASGRGDAAFTIVGRDVHHNKVPSGGDAFDVKLVPARGRETNAGVGAGEFGSGAGTAGVVTEVAVRQEVGQALDRGDGTYEVVYSSVASGPFELHVRLRPQSDRGLQAQYFASPLLLGEPLELAPRTTAHKGLVWPNRTEAGFAASDGAGTRAAAASAGGAAAGPSSGAFGRGATGSNSSGAAGAGALASEAFGARTVARVEDPPLFGAWSLAGRAGDGGNFVARYDADAMHTATLDDVRRAEGSGAEGGLVARGARWSGFVSVPVTEAYTFTVVVAPGARALGGGGNGGTGSTAKLFVNDALVVAVEAGAAGGDGGQQASAPILLAEAKLHGLVLEAADRSGEAMGGGGGGGSGGGLVEVWWESDRVPRQRVPPAFFHPPTFVVDDTEAREAAAEAASFAAREGALLGSPVAGSPFAVYVSPGAPFAPHCVASGLGRRFDDDQGAQHGLYGYANKSSTLELVARDVFGNTLDGGGAEWFVRVTFNGPYAASPDSFAAPLVLTVAPADLGNGSYVAQFTPGGRQLREGAYVSRDARAGTSASYTIDAMLAIPAWVAVRGYGLGGSGSRGLDALRPYYAPGGLGDALAAAAEGFTVGDFNSVSGGRVAAALAARGFAGIAAARVTDNGGGGGLLAEYFADPFLGGSTAVDLLGSGTADSAVAVRIDGSVDLFLPPPTSQQPHHHGGSGAAFAPPPGVGVWPALAAPFTVGGGGLGEGSVGVSVRWSGLLKAPADGAFVFELDLGPGFNGQAGSAAGSTGARLFIDDELVLATDSAEAAAAMASATSSASASGAAGGAASAAASGAVLLSRGVLYRLRVEFQARHGGGAALGGARCRLLWRSGMTPLQVVPPFFLYPTAEHIDGSPLPLKVFDK